MQLNPQQSAAVHHVDSPLLVLAGAGSGKTGVITQKIAYLIRERDMPARHIFAVTFTNKAANEMRARLTKMLGRDATKPLHVSTFHTLGLRLLREDGAAVGLRSGMTIMDGTDCNVAIKQLRAEDNRTSLFSDDQLRWAISAWKNDQISASKALSIAEDDLQLEAAEIYRRYDRLLRAYNAVDFDDLLVLPTQLLQDPALLEKWQNRVRHLLVDEYQDTNGVQYDLVKQLVGQFGGLTAVGDDDQSVYSWRGAKPENLGKLQQDFPNLRLIKLEQNYRSTVRVLRSANKLIANNPHLFEKALWSDLGLGEKLRVMPCRSADDEADWVSSEIHTHHFNKRGGWSDYAVLYRSNFQARTFERALREKNIPYKLSGGSSFFDKPEVKDVLSYLRLLVNPTDDTAYLRVVNTPRREIGASTLEKLGNYASERGCSMLEASGQLGLSEKMQARSFSKVQNFYQWVQDTSELATKTKPTTLLAQLLEDVQYQAWLYEAEDTPKAAEKRWGNVAELLNWISGILEREPDADLTRVVNRLTLMDILDGDEEEYDAVNLMTLHASKGLEFPYVFMVGTEEELLPHRNSLSDEAIEEERRLAYVGVTRAQRELTFTYAKYRKRQGEKMSCEYSRFISELPEEDLEWLGEKANAETNQKSGRAALAGLRAMLNGDST